MILPTFKKLALALGAMTIIYSVSSCNKMLDVKPTDQVDGSEIFNSISTVNKAVLGVYADWQTEYMLRIGSVMADECRIGLRNAGVNGSAQNLFRWRYAAGDAEISAPWVNAYQVINRANRILEGIDKVPADNEADVKARAQLKGELLAIRAFEHFELYRGFSFSGVYNAEAWAVPYVTSTDISNKPARPTSAAFFQALGKDIETAVPLMENEDNKDVTRMNILALYALQSRVALYTGNWQTAVESATRAIGKVPLAGRDEFPNIWTDQGNAEVLFRLRRTNQSTLRPGDIWRNGTLGIYYFAPSLKLLAAYDQQNDVRYASYFYNDPSLAAGGQLTDVIGKYAGTQGAVNLNDVKVFRIAEMYLIRAEAYQHLGRLEDGSADLNILRSARINGYVPKIYTDGAKLLNAILTERFRELPFEGHRYFDLKRLGLPVTRLAADLQQGDTQTDLAFTDQYYYLPVPQAETLANPNIKPNNQGW